MDEKPRKKSWQEKSNAFYVILIVILVVLLSCVIVVLKLKKIYGDNICVSADCVNSSEFFLDIINISINPCDNFYEFACGGYEGHTSTLEEAEDRVIEEFRSFITGSINDEDSDSVKKQKIYYRTCTNTLAIEEDDNRSFKKIIEHLGGMPLMSSNWLSTHNFEKLTTKAVDLGLYYDWFINVDFDTLYDGETKMLKISHPTDVKFISKAFEKNYQLLIENVVKRLRSNNSLDNISSGAKGILEFEKSLTQIIQVSNNSYIHTTIDDLKYRFPHLPWSALLKNVNPNNQTITVAADYITRLVLLLERSSIKDKINYIFWKITQTLYQFLSYDIRREFEAYDSVVKNKETESREDFCYRITQTLFAYVSEAAYARKYESETQLINVVFANIKNVMHDHINKSKWMNQTHKTYALTKLQNIKLYIGGPDEVFDIKKFDQLLGVDEIDILNLKNTLDIVLEVDKSRDKYNLDLQRKQISYRKARLYQDIINIQATTYLPTGNLIFLPSAVIGGVFNNQKGLNVRDYSVLGTIIAHETAHAFGVIDNYINFNRKDVMRWSNSTYQAFLNESMCILEQCLEFERTTLENDTKCGKIFDENFADYVSIDIAYEAFKKIKEEDINQLPGLNYTSSQLFWIRYASTMCDSLNSSLTTISPRHLESQYRILGSYRNSKHFANDFNCTGGSYMNPSEKCTIL